MVEVARPQESQSWGRGFESLLRYQRNQRLSWIFQLTEIWIFRLGYTLGYTTRPIAFEVLNPHPVLAPAPSASGAASGLLASWPRKGAWRLQALWLDSGVRTRRGCRPSLS